MGVGEGQVTGMRPGREARSENTWIQELDSQSQSTGVRRACRSRLTFYRTGTLKLREEKGFAQSHTVSQSDHLNLAKYMTGLI